MAQSLHVKSFTSEISSLCLFVCGHISEFKSMFVFCSVEVVDGERRANLHHSCSAATTAPACAFQGNNTHTHANSQVPAQHYYPLNLTWPLNTISLFIYWKWCVAVCLPASLSHSCVCLPPQIAPVEIDESYDEMKQDARTCLSLMSQGLLYPEHIPLVLAALEEVRTHSRMLITHAALWTCCQCFNPNAAQDAGLEKEQPGVIVKREEKVKVFLL